MLALLLDNHLKEEACMKYVNAKNLLPDALVKELQRYIQGGYLYIPADQAQQKRWGESSGYRQALQQRNRQIVAAFRNGTSMEALAEKYFLSVSAIRKIIYQK
ncbi:MAG: CD3324 family protein [Christensenellales bacterium]|nr:CD3324 family protein [Christensenellales bacterium]